VRKFVLVLSVGALLVAGCSGGGSDDTPATTVTTVTESAPPPATGTPPAADAAPAEYPPSAQGSQGQWPMPNLVGVTLQDAQDQIQALTAGSVFYTRSHDLSGKDRSQVLDANWQVCTQNVAAGAAITPDSMIDFGVVKNGESCP
jgi:hypothetical protein